MTLVRVFANPPVICDITTPNLVVRSFATPGEVARALAFLHWDMGTAAVVDLELHGLLGGDVVDYITSRHPLVGLWGIAGLCPAGVVDIIGQLDGREIGNKRERVGHSAPASLPSVAREGRRPRHCA